MAAYFFLAMGCVSMVKSLQYGVYLGNVGFDWRLPLLYGVSALLSTPLVVLFQFLSRWYSHIGLAISTVGLLFCSVLVLILALHLHGSWFSSTFYIWSGIFTLLLPTLGWIVSYDLFSTREGKRVFGTLGMGGILGGAFGGYYTFLMADALGAGGLLIQILISLAALGGLLAWVHRSTRLRIRGRAAAGEPSVEEGLRAPLGEWLHSPYLRYMGALVLCTAIGTTIIDLNYVWSLNHHYQPTTEGIARFISGVLGSMFVASALIQAFLTVPFFRRYGAGKALLLPPALLLAGLGAALAVPGFWPAVFVKGVDGSFRPSLHRTALEILYLPAATQNLAAFRSFIELVVYRGGDAIGALSFLALSGVERDAGRGLAALAMAVCAAWLFFALRLQKEYVSNLRETLRQPGVDRTRALLAQESAAEEILISALRNPDPTRVRMILHQLGSCPVEMPDRVLPVQDEECMQACLAQIQSEGSSCTGLINSLVRHEDPAVGAAAFHLLVRSDPTTYLEQLRQHLDSEWLPEAVYLYYLDAYVDSPGQHLVAYRVLRWCESIPETHLEVLARIMGKSRDPAFLPVLRRWLDDPNVKLKRAAAESIGYFRDTRFLPILAGLLADSRTRLSARKGLIGYGEKAVGYLDSLLRDSAVEAGIKQEIPLVLREIPRQSARSSLVAALYRPDPVVSYRSLKVLNKMRVDAELSYSAPSFLPLLGIWAKQYYRLLNLHEAAMQDGSGPAGRLLRKVTNERAAWTLEKIFRTLELFLPRGDAYLSYLAFCRGQRDMRENAVEFLDLHLRGDMRAPLLPIFEEENSRRLLETGRSLFGLPSAREEILRDMLFEADSLLLACILAAMRESGLSDLLHEFSRLQADVHPLVRETASWAITDEGVEQ